MNEKYKENFIFFLNTSILKDIEYFIYISGHCSVELPEISNVKYFYIENKNHDFGALFEFNKNNNSIDYDAYIFINSSVRGPFIPSYNPSDWYKLFTSKLTDKVGLVGSSICTLPLDSHNSIDFEKRFNFDPPYVHVQTTAYALSSVGYKVLLKNDFFKIDKKLHKNKLVLRYEILLSQLLLKNGLIISSLLPTLESFSSKKKNTRFPDTAKNGDPLYKSGFYGRSLSPMECVFIKTNRNIISDKELASYTFTSLIKQQENQLLNKDGVDLFQNSLKKLQSGRLLTMLIKKLKLTLKKILNN